MTSTYTAIVEAGQDIYDISIQEYGSIEQVFLLMSDNVQLDLVTELETGQELIIRKSPNADLVPNQTQMNFFRERQIRVLNAGFPSNEILDLRDHDGDHDEDHN